MAFIRAAIFDMDGLMIDSEGISIGGWVEAGKRMGYPVTRDFANTFRGTTQAYSRGLCREKFGEGFDYDLARAIHDEYVSGVFAREGVRVKPGLPELLDWLDGQGIPAAVATSTSQPLAEERLRIAGIMDRYCAYMYGSQVKNSKPHPEIFQRAADLLSAAPQESAVFEDSPNGVAAAIALGGLSFAVPDAVPLPEALTGKATAVTETLAGTIPLLREHQRREAEKALASVPEQPAPMTVTFLGHSGFMAETPEETLVFDWWKGDMPPIRRDRPLYVFASHSHGDHFDPRIFGLAKAAEEVFFVLSSDIETCGAFRNVPEKPDHIVFTEPRTRHDVNGISVRTYRSTDMGCAFAVRTGCASLWHAGDLNWWTWPGEETEEEFREMTRDYRTELLRAAAEAEGRPFDAAFVPLDPRQGKRYGWGMAEFLRTVPAVRVFPMHCWGDRSVAERFLETDIGSAFARVFVPLMGRGEKAEL